MAAVGASLARGLGAVRQVLFQCAFHTHLPGVDRLRIEFQTAHEFEHLVDRHTIAQHARDELGIVPVLGVELVAQTLDGGFVAALVDELEVVTYDVMA